MITYTTKRVKGAATFEVSGELPPYTRRVQIKIDDERPFGEYRLKEAQEIIEHSYDPKYVQKHEKYYILPAPVTKMSEETKEKLRRKHEG
jgi:hypothetical protein